MQTHHLKTDALYFDAVERREKTYEVRKNDRFFQTGDVVVLHRIDPFEAVLHFLDENDPNALRFRIGAFLQGGQFGIEPGYCVFSLLPVEQSPGKAE